MAPRPPTSPSSAVPSDRQEGASSGFELLTELIEDGVVLYELATGAARFSARWHEIAGIGPDVELTDLGGWLERVHPDDLPNVENALARVLRQEGGADCTAAAPAAQSAAVSFRLVLPDGTLRPVRSSLALSRGEDGTTRLLATLHREAEQAIYDDLTGLPNRSLLKERLQHALERYHRDPARGFAVLFLDLNNFKVINDSLGHRIGDLLLIEIARRLLLCVRSADTVARLGGDEFVVLLEGTSDHDTLYQIVNRIHRYTSSRYELEGFQVVSSSSIGVVDDVARYENIDDILRDADIAMYEAKSKRRPYVPFDARMYARASDRQRLEMDLRRALERNELYVLYQPIVSLSTGAIAGYEALARWRHPTRGLLNPSDFIPIAEETGLIVPLGSWVLHESCRQLRAWLDAGSAAERVTVSVNISSKQLFLAGFLPHVREVLASHALPAEHLRLEVTESVLMEDAESAARMLHALKRLGVSIALDDFGTGFSSLHYLHSLPLDTLKIDRSFVERLETDVKSREIIRTFVSLARSLKLESVSEGVERPAQAALLRELNCSHAQGFYYARPGVTPELEPG